jgi:hypothetical protein
MLCFGTVITAPKPARRNKNTLRLTCSRVNSCRNTTYILSNLVFFLRTNMLFPLHILVLPSFSIYEILFNLELHYVERIIVHSYQHPPSWDDIPDMLYWFPLDTSRRMQGCKQMQFLSSYFAFTILSRIHIRSLFFTEVQLSKL